MKTDIHRTGILYLSLLVIIAIVTGAETVSVNGNATSDELSKYLSTCIAFRLDDVQDYFIDKPQMEIIKIFTKTNSNLTLGIIGNAFGNDTELVKTINKSLGAESFRNSHGSEIEIANHGWNHEDFTQFTAQEQDNLMENANNKISRVLSISPPTGFIPPYNKFNNDTVNALKNNNMTYISSNTTIYSQKWLAENHQYPASNRLLNYTIYNLPATARTGDSSSDDTYWYGEKYQQVLAQIDDGLSKYKYAVILMHPQEYSIREGLDYENKVDWDQINELKILLGKLKAGGARIVTLGEMGTCLATS